jgi:hypothetical protein
VKPRTHSRSRRSARQQRLGWLLAALVLLIWPAAFLHEATTVHAVCPEHGERLDVAKSGALPASVPAGPEEEGEHFGDGDETGAHEECPFVLLAQPTSAESHAPEWRAELRETHAVDVRAAEQRHSSVPLLLLAPKQSPPV